MIDPNADHFSFAVQGIPALRLIAGFGERRSKLRHALTAADKRAFVNKQALVNALKITNFLINNMSNSTLNKI